MTQKVTRSVVESPPSLAAGLPSMFGFSVYSSMPGVNEGTGDIPMPQHGDKLEGGHAVAAVGYDDGKKIGKEKGAIMGHGVGREGVRLAAVCIRGRRPLAVDFWSLVEAEFVDTDLFK